MEKFLRMHKEEEEEEELAICPSFKGYRDGVAEVAARVQTEVSTSNQQPDDEEDTFEFSKDFNFSSLIMASQIRLVYPVFNRDLMPREDDDRRRNRNQDHDWDSEIRPGDDVERARLSFKNLFVDEPDHPSSCSSSSEADELDKMQTGPYCFRKLKSPSPSKSRRRRKKSNSTESCSKRWRFLDLLKRCSRDGKADSLKAAVAVVKTKVKGETVAAAHKAFYVKNKAAEGGDKRRSYLPYRLDLLGFFRWNIPNSNATNRINIHLID